MVAGKVDFKATNGFLTSGIAVAGDPISIGRLASAAPSAGVVERLLGVPVGRGMQLWNLVKYDQLLGIVDVPSVRGDFSYSQDYTIEQDEYFGLSLNWKGAENVGMDSSLEGDEMESALQEVWDAWEFTVQGYGFDEPLTWTLDELIDEFASEGIVIKDNCAESGLGGAMVAAGNAKGIKLQNVFDAVAANMSADYIVFNNIAGRNTSVITERLVDAWLVYEINGGF